MEARESSKGVEEKTSCTGVVVVEETLKQDVREEQIQKVEDAPLIGVLVEAAAALEADAVARGSEELPSTTPPPPPVNVEVKTVVENTSVKRKRGRPPKDAVSVSVSAARGTEEGSSSAPVSVVEVKTMENNSGKRPRGRPPKEAVVVAIDVVRTTEEGSSSVPVSAEVKNLENSIGKRTRGRPPKEPVVIAAIDVAPPAEEGSSLALASVEVKTFEDGSEKRKRGRPPKGLPKLPQPVKKKKDEEDVCFICFDGGSLVLCDRRGCPKAYHPSCVKRDEAFFQSKARWDCGWHICSNCEKAANYMCYTCTYSLCKACTRDADYVCVRENKGFCSMCMKTIMLIEKKDQRENETVVVDFDDKSSWEYLFKMYWLYSKQKLSLTLDELTKARNPWSVDGHIIFEGRDIDAISGKNDLQHPIFGIHSESKETKVFCGSKGSNHQTQLLNGNFSPTINKLDSDEGAHAAVSAKWASKELLAFVAHVKNGDISELSIQDAQALLSDYVKKNNLPDPSQKSQIICDARLSKLFGKPRVGHIEMLKLLEFHFPIKDDSLEDVNRSSVYPAVASQANSNTNISNFLAMGTEIKSKTLKMGEDKGPPANLHEYAAVDVHNISLIYLRRSLLENLIDESGKLHNIAVGSFVRIGVSGGDHEQDIFRLVQVVGTCMVAKPYKIGEKSVNVALEILNLDKKEAISISALSNQMFSEDECRRLRESIKCGLVKHLTVGQILEKSKALREVIMNDWLEKEVIRLNQLRDQANEKGQEKELREFVEKIELMKSPEERQRRLLDVPEVHIDRHMKANSQSDQGAGLFAAKNQAAYGKTRGSGLNINEKEAISSKDNNKSYPTRNKKSKVSSNNIDKKENKYIASDSAKPSNGGDKGAKTDVGGSNTPAAVTSIPISGISSEASVASLSTGTSPPPLVLLNNEADNLWHYRDPDGNIQGPFCLLMLRKWSLSGYFPPDLRIWSIYDKEANSLLLLNLLKGQPPNKPTSVQQPSLSLPSQEVVVQVAKENASNICLPSVTSLDDKQSANCQDKLESASWTPPAVNCIDINKSGSPCLESVKVNDLSSKQMETSKECGNDDENRICRENNDRDYFSHSSGNSWRPPIFAAPPNKLDLNTSFSFETKSTNSSVSDIPIMPNPNERSKERQSELLNVHIQGGSQLLNPPKPTLNLDYNMEEKRVPGSEKKQSLSLSSNFVVRDSGPTWSSSSGLFLGGGSVPPPPPQPESPHPEGSNVWVGHPPAAKASVEELGLGLIPVHPKAEPSNNYPPSTDNIPTISQTHPTSGWLAMVTEPIELSTLAEESVSDLLAEVDAMESQGGLPSPTSAMNYVDYLFEDTVNDCFNPIGPLSRTINSTGNVHLAAQQQQQQHHHQSSNIQETPLQADRHTEAVRTGKPNNNWQQKDSSSHIPESSSISHEGIKRASWPTNLDVGLGNMNSGWEGGGGGITAAAAATGRVNGNVHRSGQGVYTGGRDGNSSRYGGERVTSQSGRHGGGGGNDQNRQSLSWSRHSLSVGSGSGSGGNYSRGGGSALPPPSHKGGQQQQRVCKFYESGRCKKGAYCDYLHP
ncbi:zinc finger CCCH domain-containing protein 44-like [Impatiens glandulifera]|uniref:zinc finger CCCH domain-containing protein 44-like n=1 Tax=Impatiens glandulifera TaxID=253017 RepID=UPI001FB0F739|nr:zinc finger CCCH domain-containing protein 44-like [Impatiens glandulifera]